MQEEIANSKEEAIEKGLLYYRSDVQCRKCKNYIRIIEIGIKHGHCFPCLSKKDDESNQKFYKEKMAKDYFVRRNKRSCKEM